MTSCPGPETLEIRVDEQMHEPFEVERRRPAQPLARPRSVTDEIVQLCLPAHERVVDPNVLLPVEPDPRERAGGEVADAVRHAARDHEVARLVLLDHRPHRAHVVARVAPVTPRVERAERHVRLEAEAHGRGRVRDLAGDELERAPRRLVVVEDPGGRVEPVAPPVAQRDEVRVGLRHAVRRDRPKRRLLHLRHLARLAEDLARRRLVEADRVVDATDRLEQRRAPDCRELGGDHRLLPRHRHERGRREVVDLLRPTRREHVHERQLVEHVGLRELEVVPDRLEVLERGRDRLSHDAEHLVPLGEEELCEERSVLTGDADDECASRRHGSRSTLASPPHDVVRGGIR